MAAEVTQDVQTITRVVFWVKEGTDSPYQGVLHIPSATYAAMSPAQLKTAQLAQHTEWKANLAALRNKPAPTKEQLADEAVALLDQAAELAAKVEQLKLDPAVAAAIELKRPTPIKGK